MVCSFLNQLALCCKGFYSNLENLTLLFNTCGINDIAKKNIIEPISEIFKRLQHLKKINLWIGFLSYFL